MGSSKKLCKGCAGNDTITITCGLIAGRATGKGDTKTCGQQKLLIKSKFKEAHKKNGTMRQFNDIMEHVADEYENIHMTFGLMDSKYEWSMWLRIASLELNTFCACAEAAYAAAT